MAYTTYTLADLQGQLAARWDASPFWTADEARLALNETFSLWNLLVGAWRKRFVIPTIASSPYYSVPAGAFVVLHVTWGERPVDPGAIADLDSGQPGWRSETIATPGVPTQPTIWAPMGFTRFALWPSETSAARTLALDAVVPAPTLQTATDTADVSEADLGVLLGMALRLAAFKVPGQRFAELESRETAFFQAAAVQSAAFRASAVFRALLGRDRGRAHRPHLAPADPSMALPASPAGGA